MSATVRYSEDSIVRTFDIPKAKYNFFFHSNRSSINGFKVDKRWIAFGRNRISNFTVVQYIFNKTQISYNSEFLDQGGYSYKCISATTSISFKHIHIQGWIQDFKLKKLRRAEGGAKFFWYFVWKITILSQKIIFFPILGGGARRVHPPGSAPDIVIRWSHIVTLDKLT